MSQRIGSLMSRLTASPLAPKLAAVSAAPALAQQPVLNDRVAKSMPTQYLPPRCKLKPNHFKVSSGATYLKSAIESEVPDAKGRILNDGERVLLEAMKQNGQEKNPAAWYFLVLRRRLNSGEAGTPGSPAPVTPEAVPEPAYGG